MVIMVRFEDADVDIHESASCPCQVTTGGLISSQSCVSSASDTFLIRLTRCAFHVLPVYDILLSVLDANIMRPVKDYIMIRLCVGRIQYNRLLWYMYRNVL